jgi:catechol 2,3-dioxygenase-like lactoylglutathione lyase family enzyme
MNIKARRSAAPCFDRSCPDQMVFAFWNRDHPCRKKVRGGHVLFGLSFGMSVQVYGCNHVAIEVDDIEKAVAFYKDVFNLEQMNGGEGDAFFKLGEHQFLAIFEVEKAQPANVRHFGIMVRDEEQIAEVRKKLTEKYKLKLQPPFRCDFHDPWGNRIQVVDLHDESLVWLLPYGEVQKTGIKFDAK